MNGAVISLASSPISDPASEDASSYSVVGLLFLRLLEPLLQINNLLRLSVKTLLSESFFLIGFLNLNLGSASLRANFKQILALALVLYDNCKNVTKSILNLPEIAVEARKAAATSGSISITLSCFLCSKFSSTCSRTQASNSSPTLVYTTLIMNYRKKIKKVMWLVAGLTYLSWEFS
jgi:hypothetical protein